MIGPRLSKRVALLVETSNAYGRGLLAGIHEFTLTRPDWSIYLVEHSRAEAEHSWLQGWSGQGVVARIENEHTAEVIRALSLPTVDVSAKRLIPNLPCVETDDAAVAEWALTHFAERGIQNVAFCADDRYGWSLARGEAFTAGARARGMSVSRFALFDDAARSARREDLVSWLSSLPKPVGVLACYDIAGQEVLEACRTAGIHVPDQVAVLGVDDDELFCNLATPALSSIHLDARGAGFLAAEILDRMMAGGQHQPVVHSIAPLHIATRQSSDLIAVQDPLVAEAVRFIRLRSDTAITVDDVSLAVGLSRRAMDQRFVRAVGRSAHAQIVVERAHRVARLLTATDWTLPRIAEQLGFAHSEYMSVMFKRQTGMSPGQYRRANAVGPSTAQQAYTAIT